MTKQTQTFQAETKELLQLMIHSLYSHREIFLRELISNASDAIEKLKFESLTNRDLAGPAGEFEIRLETDKAARTLSITDNGIGMTYEEVVGNIGTIAHSGTKAFLKMNEELKARPELIGQFGVGFYSSFMVASKVVLKTQKVGSKEAVIWESDGSGSYTIERAPGTDRHGTTITLYLKSEPETEESKTDEAGSTEDFLDDYTLKSLVKKYSDFIPVPIRMKTSREETKDGKTETVVQDEVLNSQKALWLRPAAEVTKDEYHEFYRHISHDWVDPLKTIHYRAEGTSEFTSILFVPAQKPYNYDYRDRKIGLSLYVKRVFIKGDCEELIPPYLRFIKGMVDSDDLSLNVSREILQQDREVVKIRKALTAKITGSLKEMLEQDRAGYEKFWSQFGPTVKEGIASDPATSDRLRDLLLFQSTASEKLTTLKEYVQRMKPGQKAIYYITGEALSQLKTSPYLEKLRAKEYEVLLMTDGVDGWVATNLQKYDEKELQSITASDLDLETEEEKKQTTEKFKDAESKLRPLLETMKEALKDQVKEIKLSQRLVDSPVCLVSDRDAMTAHMERLMESMGQQVPKRQRTLEINPFHPLYEKMLKASTTHQVEWSEILYDQALLNEGSPIHDPQKYSQRIAKLMIEAAGSA